MPLGGLQPSTEEGRDSIVQGLLFESSKTKEIFQSLDLPTVLDTKIEKQTLCPRNHGWVAQRPKRTTFPSYPSLDSGEIGLNSSSVFSAQDWSLLFVKPETSRCFDQNCKFSAVRTIESENVFQVNFKWKTQYYYSLIKKKFFDTNYPLIRQAPLTLQGIFPPYMPPSPA